MENISSLADLRDAISELEFNKAVHRRMLKDSFNDTIESLKPGNVIKNLIQAVKNPGLLPGILPIIVSIGASFISSHVTKKISSGGISGNRFKRILMSVALYGAARALIKNPELHRIFVQRVMNSVFSK
jgi:hypothetical protein